MKFIRWQFQTGMGGKLNRNIQCKIKYEYSKNGMLLKEYQYESDSVAGSEKYTPQHKREYQYIDNEMEYRFYTFENPNFILFDTTRYFFFYDKYGNMLKVEIYSERDNSDNSIFTFSIKYNE